MNYFISLLSGFVFSLGLVVSGMINPSKVKGFLDIFGNWDYSLAFVMGGAVIFNIISFKILKNKKPLCADSHFLPTKNKADRNLVIGAILFGAGWGLIGICPGPALVNIATLSTDIFIFIGAMLFGMVLFSLVEKKVS